ACVGTRCGFTRAPGRVLRGGLAVLNYFVPAPFWGWSARRLRRAPRRIAARPPPPFAGNGASLSLRADRSHHLAEALGFGRNERRELRRRGGDRLGALVGHLLHDLRIPPRLHQRRIEL